LLKNWIFYIEAGQWKEVKKIEWDSNVTTTQNSISTEEEEMLG